MDYLASQRGSRFDPVLTNPVWESTGNLPVRFVKEVAIVVVTEERALFCFLGSNEVKDSKVIIKDDR